MTAITGSSDARIVTISDAGVRAVLNGTPLGPFAGAVIQYAHQYGIDPNFFLAYVKFENDFCSPPPNGNTFSFADANPYDIVCVRSCDGSCSGVGNCGDPSGNNFAVDCQTPGNRRCYAVYPNMPTGIQAAFWQTAYWITPDGFAPTWASLLGVAGWGPGNIPEITAQATIWSNQYPPTGGGGGGCPPDYYLDNNGNCVYVPPATEPLVIAGVLGLGLLAIAGAAYLTERAL